MNYYNPRTGLSYKIVGLIDEDDIYEVYQLKAKHNHNLILHVLKNGNGRRFDVKELSEPVSQDVEGKTATRAKAVLPWIGDGNEPMEQEL